VPLEIKQPLQGQSKEQGARKKPKLVIARSINKKATWQSPDFLLESKLNTLLTLFFFQAFHA
jgi:hypothetical protein